MSVLISETMTFKAVVPIETFFKNCIFLVGVIISLSTNHIKFYFCSCMIMTSENWAETSNWRKHTSDYFNDTYFLFLLLPVGDFPDHINFRAFKSNRLQLKCYIFTRFQDKNRCWYYYYTLYNNIIFLHCIYNSRGKLCKLFSYLIIHCQVF